MTHLTTQKARRVKSCQSFIFITASLLFGPCIATDLRSQRLHKPTKELVGFVSPIQNPTITSPGSRKTVAPAMISSPQRGGGASLQSVSQKLQENGEIDPVDEKAIEALKKIRFCYRACFVKALTYFFVNLPHIGVLWQRRLTWLEIVDLLGSFNLLSYGFGLRSVYRIYKYALVTDEDLTQDYIFKLCRTMARVWMRTTLVMVAISTTCATDGRKIMGLNIEPFKWQSGLLSLILAGGLAIRSICVKNVSEVLDKEDEKNTPKSSDAFQSRKMGFRATRNMLFCSGSIFLIAAMEFIIWLLKRVNLIERALSVFNFITPATIALLLVTLYKSFLNAVVIATESETSDTAKEKVYTALFESQIGYYSNVGEMLVWDVVFSWLPIAYLVVKPFLPSS